ncbi:MAG: hypothetical protein QOG87_3385 [Actinomycetota bacterium]
MTIAPDPVLAPPEPPPLPPAKKASPWWQSKHLNVVVGVVLVAASVGVYLVGRDATPAAAGEVFLEPADQRGANAFSPSIVALTGAGGPAAVASPTPGPTALVNARADSPGLYAGNRDVANCNAAQLVTYLEGNPARASAWASAVQIDPGQIKAFVATLTPVLLRVDTRVTEYAFAAGKPRPTQAVLQAGTAVLLDRTAFPRVRCQSGNPVGQPRAVSSKPRYVGPRWRGFSPRTTVVVRPSARVGPLVLIDARTGQPFVRIPGSIVITDIDRPPTGITIIVVEPGGLFTVSGTRWPAGTALTVTFDNPAVTLGTPTADGAGNFAIAVTAPREAAQGLHQVAISGGGVSINQPVYVIPLAPTARVGPAPAQNRTPAQAPAQGR